MTQYIFLFLLHWMMTTQPVLITTQLSLAYFKVSLAQSLILTIQFLLICLSHWFLTTLLVYYILSLLVLLIFMLHLHSIYFCQHNISCLFVTLYWFLITPYLMFFCYVILIVVLKQLSLVCVVCVFFLAAIYIYIYTHLLKSHLYKIL